MNWRDIAASPREGVFLYKGEPIFKKYISLLKFHEPGLAPVEDESGWYHITSEGVPLYTTRYKRTFGFYGGLAAVTDSTGCFHINAHGHRAYTARYEWCGNYQENLCVVRNSRGKYFHIDMCGERLYESEYLYAGDFRDGIASVKCGDGLFRHIDSKGTFINGKGFIDLGVFHKGIATARDNKGWFHIDHCGDELYGERYLSIEPFYNGFALVTCRDASKMIIDETGNGVLHI